MKRFGGRRKPRGREVASVLVGAMQLAAAAWVPLIHPLLHAGEIATVTAVAVTEQPADSDEPHAQEACWVCVASVGFPEPAADASALHAGSVRTTVASPAESSPNIARGLRANRVRAPPHC